MEIVHQNPDIEEMINRMKTLATIPNDQLIKHLPSDLSNQIGAILITDGDHSGLDEVICKLNQIADCTNDPHVLDPIVQNFALFKDDRMRVLNSVEITVFHYQLLLPSNLIINTNDLINVTYSVPKTNTCLLRAFFYWAGCVFLQMRLIPKAEFFFYNCCQTPTDLKKISKFGVEAAKKLTLLCASHNCDSRIPAPYSRAVPTFYKKIEDYCRKLDFPSIETSFSNVEIAEKDGNLELLQYVYEQCQFMALDKIAKAYSCIGFADVMRKIKITRSSLSDRINEAREIKGRDWTVMDEIIIFGNNNKIDIVENQVDVLRRCEITLVAANDYMNLKKKTTEPKKKHEQS